MGAAEAATDSSNISTPVLKRRRDVRKALDSGDDDEGDENAIGTCLYCERVASAFEFVFAARSQRLQAAPNLLAMSEFTS